VQRADWRVVNRILLVNSGSCDAHSRILHREHLRCQIFPRILRPLPPQLELTTKDEDSWLSPPSGLKSRGTSISRPLAPNTIRAPLNKLQLSFKWQGQIVCLWLDEIVMPTFYFPNVLSPHYRRKTGTWQIPYVSSNTATLRALGNCLLTVFP